MKYIIASDKSNYSSWQIETLLSNLRNDLGVDLRDVYVLLGNRGYNKRYKALQRKFKECNFWEYRNLSIKEYPASVKPFLLWKFFEVNEYLVDSQWMLLDPDVVITESLGDFETGTIWVSDCSSYMNKKYLSDCGWDSESMAEAFDVSVDTIDEIDDNIGGAQYVFDSIPADVWKNSYDKIKKAYHTLLTSKRRGDDEKRIQAWCTEMWAVAYCLFEYNTNIRITNQLDFSFSTDNVNDVKRIIHNAGVTEDAEVELFNKGDYDRVLPPDNLEVDDMYVNWIYYQYVLKR